MQFKNISPDIADAVVVAYPSPHLLLEVVFWSNWMVWV
jgi:hypothetical protein